jgi:vacuolar-type H+-ATPase catalytic subunit A/Vma1
MVNLFHCLIYRTAHSVSLWILLQGSIGSHMTQTEIFDVVPSCCSITLHTQITVSCVHFVHSQEPLIVDLFVEWERIIQQTTQNNNNNSRIEINSSFQKTSRQFEFLKSIRITSQELITSSYSLSPRSMFIHFFSLFFDCIVFSL